MSSGCERARTERRYSAICAGGHAPSGGCQNVAHAVVGRHAAVGMRKGFLIAARLLVARQRAPSGELRFGRRDRRRDPSRFVGCLRHGRTIHEIRQIWETLSRGTRTGGNKKAPAKPGPSISRAESKTQRE